MKFIEKIKIFKDAAVSAYQEMNADRDLAESLLETAIQIQDKYELLANLCKATSESITQIRDMFSKFHEDSGSFDLQQTLTGAITVLDDYITAAAGCKSGKVTFILTYNTHKGHAYFGISDMFEHLSHDIRVHTDLMRSKIRHRNFRGAIRQCAAMTEWFRSRCTDLGLEIPEFSKVNLDKYNNTENDN